MTRRQPLAGGLMICGTSSDAGKTTVVTGLCRLLARKGIRVAPFKAQNMALNSTVTIDGAEIGRAQAAQAEAAGLEPEAAMNPILLKPMSNRSSQVVVMGRPWAVLNAAEYQKAKKELWAVVTSELDRLRRRFDVVILEGAGSPAEINLLDHDVVNLRLAHQAQLPALLVGDIDRGGVFASMYGTVGLLPDELASCIRGFVINKFRGDRSVLAPGPEDLERRTGVPTLGVLPWIDGLEIDAEDSLALRRFGPNRFGRNTEMHRAGPVIDVAVVSFPRISNITDLDALALEPDVRVRLVDRLEALGSPDLIVLPGTKSTIADLQWLKQTGLAGAIADLASRGQSDGDRLPVVLGICGGYQILGEKIEDSVESPEPAVATGLGLLPVSTVFETEKVTERRRGTALGQPIDGYEIHHGRTSGGLSWMELTDRSGAVVREGCTAEEGRILGTSLHGLLESDPFRQALLADISSRAGRTRRPSGVSFADARQARCDRMADAIERHLDLSVILRLIEESTSRS